ncbi:hypothetical protein F503_06180 [Ophiostoma piceae UAMH 11346]|uniref:Uncharacterized protein n=1 Tax=Ophiostoma piceae (strain UAMH 11346) TaxID=1262450 RepID=S3BYS3_OPHP1|nr:hypothetical protein F503_06180 [Ophiostoma piceae UAMH 11346]
MPWQYAHHHITPLTSKVRASRNTKDLRWTRDGQGGNGRKKGTSKSPQDAIEELHRMAPVSPSDQYVRIQSPLDHSHFGERRVAALHHQSV